MGVVAREKIGAGSKKFLNQISKSDFRANFLFVYIGQLHNRWIFASKRNRYDHLYTSSFMKLIVK